MPQQNRLENPLIVQSDRTLLLDVHAPRADECRRLLFVGVCGMRWFSGV